VAELDVIKQNTPIRYGLIDLNGLMGLCGLINKDQMRNEYKQWVDNVINNNGYTRESSWTESIAVGMSVQMLDTISVSGPKLFSEIISYNTQNI
jgi:hypothetical protein